MRARQRLGKYRIERKLGDGGFAAVYQAFDTLEGVRVALKVPHDRALTAELLEEFRKEVRIAAQLKHPNILSLKNADFIDHHLVLAYSLGQRTLAERLQSRTSFALAVDFAKQILDAASCAHEHRIIHCDIKPENLILFPDGELKLTDFGIAKVAERTVRASGSGTLGYCAPEQAMGKPSFRSDVFSIGLIMYRMLSGELPEWPFTWPPPAHRRLRGRAHPDLVNLIRKAIEVDPRKRFANAGAMLSTFNRVKSKALKRGVRRASVTATNSKNRDWRTIRRRQFQRLFGKTLGTNHTCSRCEGPVAESMTTCPWCGTVRHVQRGVTSFPQQCPRCNRGLKLDWKYCPWCFGGGFDVTTTRKYSDVRYSARCGNPRCTRKQLMPFMRYCPWCRRKVKRKWRIEGTNDKCRSCDWGVVGEYWTFCPWCGKRLEKK